MPITPYDFIDSSTDFGEGWSTFGTRERGVMPMLQEGVGGMGGLASEPQEFRHFPSIDQRMILDEIEENPKFGKVLTAWLHTPGGADKIGHSAKRSILNELDGSYPESKGEWITLRRRLRVILRDLPAEINKQVSRMSLTQKTAALRAYAYGGDIDFQLSQLDFGSILGGVLSSAASAGASIYGAKLQSDTQKQIATIQATSVANQAAAQVQIANAQAALVAAQQKAASGGGITGGDAGSTLVWAVPAGLGVLGLIVWLVMRSRG